MGNYDLLTSLLPLISQYETDKGAGKPSSVEDFSKWMQDQMIMRRQMTDKRLPLKSISGVPRGEELPVSLGKLIYYMYRYARFYTKKALKDNPLNSLDEFTFMITLLNIPAITKTELINKMVYDKTTGIELINRLIKQGLITEAENPADKRSKLIHVTEMGRAVLFSSFEELNKVSQIIPGKLDAEELMTLIHLLDKLDHHHLHIWDHHRDSDLGTILSSAKDK